MDFIPILQYFAANLERLLPHGASTAEITVPGILTTLLLVRLNKGDGNPYISLTETIRTMDNLTALELEEIGKLGKTHAEDAPSITTITFLSSNTQGLLLATPVFSFDHRNRKETDIFDYGEDGHILNTNEKKETRLFQSTARRFEKYHAMGFYGPEAETRVRTDLITKDKLNEEALRASVTVDYKFSTQILEARRQTFQWALTYLVNAIDESIANDR